MVNPVARGLNAVARGFSPEHDVSPRAEPERPVLENEACAGPGPGSATADARRSMVSTIAFTGLGLVVTAAQAAKDGFAALSARGERALAEDTMAGAVHRAVTRELPAAVGQALGTALERSVHAVEVTRQTAARVPASLERAVEAGLRIRRLAHAAADCRAARACRHAGAGARPPGGAPTAGTTVGGAGQRIGGVDRRSAIGDRRSAGCGRLAAPTERRPPGRGAQLWDPASAGLATAVGDRRSASGGRRRQSGALQGAARRRSVRSAARPCGVGRARDRA